MKLNLEDDEACEEVSAGQAPDEAEHGHVLVVVQRQADVAEEEEEGHQHQQHAHQHGVGAQPGHDEVGAAPEGAEHQEPVHGHLQQEEGGHGHVQVGQRDRVAEAALHRGRRRVPGRKGGGEKETLRGSGQCCRIV